jgi:hypothetical protein
MAGAVEGEHFVGKRAVELRGSVVIWYAIEKKKL